jgi:cytochrome c556
LRGINASVREPRYASTMSKPSLVVATAALAFFAATAVAQGAAPLEVRAVMQAQVNPGMLGIWDIGNNALNDEGVFDAALVDDAKWAALAKGADDLAAAGRTMAAAESFIAAAPGNTEVAEGEVTMAHVQGKLDANRTGFRANATAFADHAAKLAAAAKAHDAAATGDLVGEMDAVCESCHAEFWYGE